MGTTGDTRVLFVCANNVCRSPIAEGVFRVAAWREGLYEVVADSAGIFAGHAGQRADPRAVRAARARGYDLTRIRARQVTAADFARCQWILAMDESNLRALAAMSPPSYAGHLGLLMDLVDGSAIREVPDPYFGAPARFDEVVNLIESACSALAARLAAGAEWSR
ncbi:MAG: low molecular weight phosphotyrosine protein phosphatase [Burkholderiales bacterium]|nr:low molecular weight phosphotyrosine protein phosphatase [Burkholderiales bacterium]